MSYTTLITGASGGLGELFARLAAAEGNDLVLVARSVEKMEALGRELGAKYGITTHVIGQDLTAPDAVSRIIAAVQQKNLTITQLINNAGFGAFGLFHTTDYVQERDLLQVNVDVLTELTKALLPGMVQRKFGRILNVASTAAFQPGPLMAVYYASKAYVLSFSIALQEEVRGTGVTVSCLCPGPTRTHFQATANMQKSPLFARAMDPLPVAQAGYRGMQLGTTVIVPGTFNRIGTWLAKFAPRSWAARIARFAQTPRSAPATLPQHEGRHRP